MSTNTFAVLQAVLGVNNVDDPKTAGFQVDPNTGLSQFLTAAQNVDLDKDGYARRRVGRTKRLDLTSAHSLYAWGDRMFLVDSGTLYEVAPDYGLRALDTGVGQQPLSYAVVGGQLLYANETKVGAVDSFWGVQMPSSPLLTPTSGGMLAGRYLVAVTAVRDGVESGARQPSTVQLSAGGGITLDIAGIDPSADALNIYCTQPNGRELYWVMETTPSSPVMVNLTPPSTDTLTTLGHYPPMPGQQIALYRGHMLVASGAVLYWSQPLAYHHFRIQTDVQLFPSRITLLAAHDRGFYVGCGTGTYWVDGSNPDEWQPRLVDSRPPAEGLPLWVDGHKLPTLQAQGRVSLWATADGFVAGLADGSVQHLTDGRLAIDAHRHASLAFREENGLRQVLMSLQEKESDTRLGASDRVTCRVIKADQAIGEP